MDATWVDHNRPELAHRQGRGIFAPSTASSQVNAERDNETKATALLVRSNLIAPHFFASTFSLVVHERGDRALGDEGDVGNAARCFPFSLRTYVWAESADQRS